MTSTERAARHYKAYPWKKHVKHARRRCTDPGHKSYGSYGARGIRCVLSYSEAQVLWIRDRGHELIAPSLDRIDPDGDYTFNNCRFIEMKENRSAQDIKRRWSKYVV